MTIKYLDSKRISLLEADRTLRQGFDGGLALVNNAGSGGGGSGSVGGDVAIGTANGGNGGNGTDNDISGSSYTYAGGGGGGIWTSGGGSTGTGGSGGGGNGGASGGGAGANATGYGSGGGGGSEPNYYAGGNGSDGIVILRFATSGNGYNTPTGTHSIDTSTVSGQTIISWTAGTGTFTPTSVFDVRYLIVAGGAGGGGGFNGHVGGGGGGAGGYLAGTSLGVTAQAYTIVVGAKGAGQAGSSTAGGSGTNGGNSSFSGYSHTAIGGGGGSQGTASSSTAVGKDGGSGGGANSYVGINGKGTSTDISPTNVQDNSILVEKDTGKRYWRTPESTSDVTWNDSTDVGCSISGNTVTKTSGNGWTSGVAKTDEVISASSGGTITMTSNAINTYIGLSNVATLNQQAKHWYDVKFGFNQNSVVENGAIVSPDTAFTRVTSDTMKITVSSAGLVKYYINDVLKHTSTITASGTYFGIFSAYNTNETLTATITTSATWVRQLPFPTYTYDGVGWIENSSGGTIGTSDMSLALDTDGSKEQLYYLIQGVDNSKFILDFTLNFSRLTVGSNLFWFMGFTNKYNNMATNATNHMGILVMQESGTKVFGCSDGTGVWNGVNENPQTWVPTTGVDYHFRLTKLTSTTYKIELFSNSDRNSVTSTSNGVVDVMTDLNHIMFCGDNNAGTGNATFIISNLKFYNGVT